MDFSIIRGDNGVAISHTLDDGTPAHSFSTLMAELATIVSNTCRMPKTGPEIGRAHV